MSGARGAKRRLRRRRGVATIISGGQTGADRGGLDAALSLGIAHGGWCPRGRRAEDGAIPPRYRLRETETADYRVRTRRNVESADATVVFSAGALRGGTLLTARLAERLDEPLIVIEVQRASAHAIGEFRSWLAANRVRVLNVAGPRESEAPGIGDSVCEFLERSLGG